MAGEMEAALNIAVPYYLHAAFLVAIRPNSTVRIYWVMTFKSRLWRVRVSYEMTVWLTESFFYHTTRLLFLTLYSSLGETNITIGRAY